MNDEKIDVERTMPSPKLVNSSNKDEEKQIDGVKAVHSPEPVNESNKDEEQQIIGVKAISPEPVNGSNKDEGQQLDGEKAVCSPEPINSSSKAEQQINGPDNDFVSILQGEYFPLKAKVTEKESTGPEPIGDATDHQGLKINDSPTMELGNLNDRTNEQKNVSVSDTSTSVNNIEISVRGRVTADAEIAVDWSLPIRSYTNKTYR